MSINYWRLPRTIYREIAAYAQEQRISLLRAPVALLCDTKSSEANFRIFRILRSMMAENKIPKRFKYYYLQPQGGIDKVLDQSPDPFSSFTDLWKDGFIISRDRDIAVGPTNINYNGLDFHDIYLQAIMPSITRDSRVLEIGCGRGAWTRCLLPAAEVWALDALPLEKNQIMSHLGNPTNLHYIHVSDFSCRDLPDGYFDFLFSYDCFCHIPLEGIRAYLKNLLPKMKCGAEAVIMISDWTKLGRKGRVDKDTGNTFDNFKWFPGCWVPNDSERMTDYVRAAGWRMLDADFLKLKRDTLVRFRKE
jgi:SAM-dependent methyltransferase